VCKGAGKAQALLRDYSRASQIRRGGHPAVIHRRSSLARQRVLRRMRTGLGMGPHESHVRQVRNDLPQSRAASRAVNSSGSERAERVRRFSGMGR